jgi:hypothetical protein
MFLQAAIRTNLKKLPFLLLALHTTFAVGCKQTGDQTADKKASPTEATASATYSSNTSVYSFKTTKKAACCKGAPSRARLVALQKKE